MKKYICPVCGNIYIGDATPERCPLCKVSGNRLSEVKNEYGTTDTTGSSSNTTVERMPKNITEDVSHKMEKYYYVDCNHVQAGPILPSEFNRHEVTKNTLIWKQGMNNWIPAGQLPELASYLGQHYQSVNSQRHFENTRQQNVNTTYQKPDNFMVWTILATIFCCLATGIAAIVEANKVDNYWYAGKYQESIKAMNDARKWTFISLAIGIIGYLLLMLFGPSGLLFFQLLLLTLYVVYILITGIGTGASPIFASLLWIGGIIFLCWFIPKLFNFCF